MKEIKYPKKELNAIFWDFDGVLLASNKIRDQGFSEVLKAFPEDEVGQLMAYHQANGGLSRYVKFRYFFEEIRKEDITEDQIQGWAHKFSIIMMKLLTNKNLQIAETLDFVIHNYDSLPMYIVSGSDQNELRKLCKEHKIAQYFKRVHGSPKPKNQWIAEILKEEYLNPAQCILVGDSTNDYDAAIENGLHFMGYNNPRVEILSTAMMDLSV